MTKLQIDFLGAQVLRQKFTDDALKGLGLLEKVKHEEELIDKFCRYTVFDGLQEGSPHTGIFMDGFEPPEYYLDWLVNPPVIDRNKSTFRREIIDLFTDLGIMLPREVVEKLRQLPPKEQDYLDYPIRRNQDYEVWKAETEELLKKGHLLSAFYRIRNEPAFEIFKERLIKSCLEKKDYETLAFICYKKHIFVPELRTAAEELLSQGKVGFALAVLFILRDDKKMEEVARQLA